MPASTSSRNPFARTTWIAASARTEYSPATTYSIIGPEQQFDSQVERFPGGTVKCAKPAETPSPRGSMSAGMVISGSVTAVATGVDVGGTGVAGTLAAGIVFRWAFSER